MRDLLDPKYVTAVEEYVKERRKKLDSILNQRFSFENSLAFYKKQLPSDLLKASINSLWSIPYMAMKTTVGWIEKMGWDRAPHFFAKIPAGLETNTEKQIREFIQKEILDLSKAEGHPILSKVIKTQTFQKKIEKACDQYILFRQGIANLSSFLVILGIGMFFFNSKITDATTLGDEIAFHLTQREAESNFFLGKALGTSFYRIFPKEVPQSLRITAQVLVLILAAILSSVVGIFLDPLQQKLGIHRRKMDLILRETLDLEK